MNAADWIALGIIAFAVFCAVIYMVRRKNPCGGCGNCPYSDSCGKKITNGEKSNDESAD